MFFGAFSTNYYLINTIISPLLISLSISNTLLLPYLLAPLSPLQRLIEP
jgi:hypothetical protein